MKPTKTDATNAVLTHPHADDMPVERCHFKDPNAPLDTPAQPGFESVWITSEREREAIAAGLPILLRIWGTGHPPVSLQVPPIPAPIALRAPLTRDHADAAVGQLLARLAVEGLAPELNSAGITKVNALWQEAIDATAEIAQQVGQAIDELIDDATSTGDGSTALHPPLDSERRCNCPPSVRVDEPTGEDGLCRRCEAPR